MLTLPGLRLILRPRDPPRWRGSGALSGQSTAVWCRLAPHPSSATASAWTPGTLHACRCARRAAPSRRPRPGPPAGPQLGGRLGLRGVHHLPRKGMLWVLVDKSATRKGLLN